MKALILKRYGGLDQVAFVEVGQIFEGKVQGRTVVNVNT